MKWPVNGLILRQALCWALKKGTLLLKEVVACTARVVLHGLPALPKKRRPTRGHHCVSGELQGSKNRLVLVSKYNSAKYNFSNLSLHRGVSGEGQGRGWERVLAVNTSGTNYNPGTGKDNPSTQPLGYTSWPLSNRSTPIQTPSPAI